MSRAPTKKAIDPTKLTGEMDTAVQELIRAWNMPPAQLIDLVRNESPGIPIPPVIDGVPITPKGDQALARWADMVRRGDEGLMATADAHIWLTLVRHAFIAAIHEARKLTDASIEVIAWLEDRTKALAKESHAKHVELGLHYVPCYVFRDVNPEPFKVGPIEFLPGDRLAKRIEAAAGSRAAWQDEASRASGEDTTNNGAAVKDHRASVVRRMSRAPWVAVVEVGNCDLATARRRATDSVRLAIAGLGVVLSPARCRDIGLVNERPLPAARDWVAQAPGRDIVSGFNMDVPQVGGEEQWIPAYLKVNQPFIDWVGSAIASAFLGQPATNACPKLRMYWLNALHWFYMGSVEVSDARATICYSSALESLADGIGKGSINALCEKLFRMDRSDILATASGLTLEQAVEDVYSAARSEVVHGGRFVLTGEYADHRHLSAQMSQYALLNCYGELKEFEAKYGGKDAVDDKATFIRCMKGKEPTASETGTP